MSVDAAVGGMAIILGAIFLVTIVIMAFVRWIFRIDTIVDELTAIRKELTNKNIDKQRTSPV
jgi:hypothetical protein